MPLSAASAVKTAKGGLVCGAVFSSKILDHHLSSGDHVSGNESRIIEGLLIRVVHVIHS